MDHAVVRPVGRLPVRNRARGWVVGRRPGWSWCACIGFVCRRYGLWGAALGGRGWWVVLVCLGAGNWFGVTLGKCLVRGGFPIQWRS